MIYNLSPTSALRPPCRLLPLPDLLSKPSYLQQNELPAPSRVTWRGLAIWGSGAGRRVTCLTAGNSLLARQVTGRSFPYVLRLRVEFDGHIHIGEEIRPPTSKPAAPRLSEPLENLKRLVVIEDTLRTVVFFGSRQ